MCSDNLGYTSNQVLEVARSVLKPNILYYHDCHTGVIYEKVNDSNYGKPLIDLYKLTGKPQIPFSPDHFEITSGFSPSTLELLLQNRNL